MDDDVNFCKKIKIVTSAIVLYCHITNIVSLLLSYIEVVGDSDASFLAEHRRQGGGWKESDWTTWRRNQVRTSPW